MISIPDILSSDNIHLSLASKTKSAAIQEVLSLLRSDPRVLDFETLEEAIEKRSISTISMPSAGICIAHGRTNAVSALVLAAGRSDAGIVCCETPEPIHLFFVAGIPTAFDSEYLRIVGALVRACHNADTLHFLLKTKDHIEFLNRLSHTESHL